MESKEDEPKQIHASSFILWHSTMLCIASYAADPIDRLGDGDMSSNRFTSCSVSDEGDFKGKYLVSEAIDSAGCQYFFVCFRGTQTQDDVSVDLSVRPNFSELGTIHNGFLSRSAAFPLSPLFEAIQGGKKVVLTGHSLGGACAIILATRFFNKFSQFSFDGGQVTCVTFGSPLIGGSTVGGYLSRRVLHFHNFINDKDFVPLSLTFLQEVAPTLAVPAMAAATLGGVASEVAGAIFATVTSQVSSYTPFGQFYHVTSSNAVAPDQLSAMTASEVTRFFSAESLNALFDPARISDHAIDNYKNALWAGTPMPFPPLSPKRSRLGPVCAIPVVASCTVKGDTVIVTGRGLAFCNFVSLHCWQLPIASSFAGSDQRAVFALNRADSRLNSLCDQLSERVRTKTATNVSVFTTLGPKSAITQIHVAVNQVDEYLSPGKVLSCVLPIASLLIRSDQDASKSTTPCFMKMLHHSKALADALPIEFAFRCLEDDSSDKDLTFLKVFLLSLSGTRINWKDVCSYMMVDTLRSTITSLEREKSSRTTDSKHRLVLLRKALQCAPYKVRDVHFRAIVHPSVKATMVLGCVPDQTSFWKLICNYEQGISFSVDLYGDDEYYSIKTFFPQVSRTMELPNGFSVKTHRCDKPIIDNPGFTVFEIDIMHRASGLGRKFVHFSCAWGYGALPDDDTFNTLIHGMAAVAGDAIFLRGTNCNAPCIFLSDFEGSQHFRTGLFACGFTHRMAAGNMTSAELIEHVSHQINGASGPLLPITSEQCNFARRCSGITSAAVVGVWRQIKHAFVGKGDTVDDGIDILRDHLRQMELNYDSVYGGAICGQSVTMPVCEATDLDAPKRPFLDLFPGQLATSDLETSTAEDRQKLLNLAHESNMKAKYLTIMLEDAMTSGRKVIETEQETGVLLGFNCAIAAVQCVGYVPVAAARSVIGLSTLDYSQIIRAEAHFASLWHNTFFKQLNLSTYKDVVDQVSSRLDYAQLRSATLVEKESHIVNCLPNRIDDLSLKELIDARDTLFDPRFRPLLQGRSAGLMIFFLKTIYHCYHLRRLRKEVTLVTIAGEKNAGKTTLNLEIFGPEVVTAQTGTGSAETTIYPSAYSHPTLSDVIFCDLPGSSDQATAEMSDMFLTLGDLTVFLVRQSIAPNPRVGDVIYTTLETVLKNKGPRLICVNQADALFKRQRHSNVPYDPEAKLNRECELWVTSALFGSHLQGHADLRAPKWECEKGEQSGAIIASVRTADSALSIWMTSFEPYVEADTAKKLLFGAPHVKAWVEEASLLWKDIRSEDV